MTKMRCKAWEGDEREADKPSQMQILKSRTGYTRPPVSLVGQLFWREYFYTVGHATPNYHKMEGNQLSKQASPFTQTCPTSSDL